MPRQRILHNARLPKGLRCRDGYYSFRDCSGKEHGLGRDEAEAVKFADGITATYPNGFERVAKHSARAMTNSAFSEMAMRAFSFMVTRAKKDGREVMSKDEFLELWRGSYGMCELTRIRFSAQRMKGCTKRPWMPSVDRRDCSKGYTADNCRLVCVAVNLALNEFGDAVLMQIARSMLAAGKLRVA